MIIVPRLEQLQNIYQDFLIIAVRLFFAHLTHSHKKGSLASQVRFKKQLSRKPDTYTDFSKKSIIAKCLGIITIYRIVPIYR